MRLVVLAGLVALAGCSKSSGTEGPEGPPGPQGPQGPEGPPGQVTVLDGGTLQGPAGPQGPAGTSVQVSPLAVGDASCPQGGVQLTAGSTTTVVCNGGGNGPAGPQGPQGPIGMTGPAGAQGPAGAAGAAGAQGPAGATGPAGPAGAAGAAGSTATLTQLANGSASCPYGGTQVTVGATTTYACNGAPGGGGTATYNGGIPPVTFAGYTPQSYNGDLNGRSGAQALCNVAFTGSHFCTDWETDQAQPPAIAAGAWVDSGQEETNQRYFRQSYSTGDLYTCSGWTSAAAAQKPDGVNLGTGEVLTPLGGLASSFVGSGDGGCENMHPLACCKGGTAVRFRGFTPSTTSGNLGGRTGAQATCNAAFSGSHFCTDWETDQAAVPAPIPASGAWVDSGNGSTGNNTSPLTRYFRQSYSTGDLYTCSGWTSAAAGQKPDGVNLGTGGTLTALGGLASSFVGSGDGGCEVARPLACCDGYPPM